MNWPGRPLLIGAFLATTLAWVSVRAGPAVGRWVEEREALVTARAEAISRTRAELSGAASLGDSILRLEAVATGLQDHVLAGSDREVAGIELSRRVNDLLREQPTRISSLEMVEDGSEAVGRLRSVRVLARFTTDFQGLLTVLRSVESDEKLWTDSLAIETASAPGAQPSIIPLNITLRAGLWHASN